jgi:putative flippase GtrA
VQQSSYAIIMISALLLFSIFRRVRRNIGWQQIIQRKLVVRTIIFLVIGSLFISGSAAHPISLISDVIGIMIGVILAYYGARMTNFEERGGTWYYRPNTWIGSLVTALFFARLVYRFYEVYQLRGTIQQIQNSPNEANGFANISSTLGNSWAAGLILIMFAYYVLYYFFILQRQKQLSGAEKKTLD